MCTLWGALPARLALRATRGILRPSMPTPLCSRLILSHLLVAAAGCVDRESRHVAGSDLFLRYCASCHGADAKGNGPMAGSLKIPPADLTTLAKRAGGRFDEGAVMATIDGRRLVAAHGSREMPVWGALFEEEREREGKPFQAYVGLLQSRALSDYLRSIQATE
jgi:mono/diheme cytochrome c family protein